MYEQLIIYLWSISERLVAFLTLSGLLGIIIWIIHCIFSENEYSEEGLSQI